MEYIIKTVDHNNVVRKKKPTVWLSTDDKQIWVKDSTNKPLKFTAVDETSTLSLTNEGDNTPVLYKSTDGETWENWDYSAITLNNGESIYIKGNNPNGFSTSDENYSNFVMTGKISCKGNIMSLLGEDVTDIPCNNCFSFLFNGCTGLTTAPTLPATELANYCYEYMFYGCTGLTTAPTLPATELAEYCYSGMFCDCESLTTAPTLPATELANYCYEYMFLSCQNLTTAPELPATTLAECCYLLMFASCTSLTTAPTLPATELANGCYGNMFNGCRSLNYVKAMFTTTPSSTYTSNWLYNVSNTGTFVKNAAATWDVSGINGIPSGWTVQTATE